jgi:hypothetical protein
LELYSEIALIDLRNHSEQDTCICTFFAYNDLPEYQPFLLGHLVQEHNSTGFKTQYMQSLFAIATMHYIYLIELLGFWTLSIVRILIVHLAGRSHHGTVGGLFENHVFSG